MSIGNRNFEFSTPSKHRMLQLAVFFDVVLEEKKSAFWGIFGEPKIVAKR
jgi:hypothetical protein